jgi:hypothetical protein
MRLIIAALLLAFGAWGASAQSGLKFAEVAQEPGSLAVTYAEAARPTP